MILEIEVGLYEIAAPIAVVALHSNPVQPVIDSKISSCF